MINPSVTIELPVSAFEQLELTARQQQRPLPELVRDLVLRELPGLPPLSQAVETELEAFSSLSDDTLWLLARSTLTGAQQEELEQLNAEAQRRPLSAAEQARQQALIDAYDHVLVRRARAAALLKVRGYDLSDLAALEAR